MEEEKDYKSMYECASAKLELLSLELNQTKDWFETTISLQEKKLIEYEKKISEFNKLKWYQKLKYKF